jgi:hypothetical protein
MTTRPKWLWASCVLAFFASPAPAADVAVQAVVFFGHVGTELPDRRGSAVRSLSLDPPVSEYRRIDHWHAAEEAESPDRIDVIAVVENTTPSTVANVKVRIAIFDRVGEMKADEATGLTDIERGLRTANWGSRSVATRTIDLGDVAPGAKRSVVLRDFDLDAHLSKLEKADRWAYGLKARATADCVRGCDSNDGVETAIEVRPRD